jgi:hypothetical protein
MTQRAPSLMVEPLHALTMQADLDVALRESQFRPNLFPGFDAPTGQDWPKAEGGLERAGSEFCHSLCFIRSGWRS